MAVTQLFPTILLPKNHSPKRHPFPKIPTVTHLLPIRMLQQNHSSPKRHPFPKIPHRHSSPSNFQAQKESLPCNKVSFRTETLPSCSQQTSPHTHQSTNKTPLSEAQLLSLNLASSSTKTPPNNTFKPRQPSILQSAPGIGAFQELVLESLQYVNFNLKK